MRPVLDLVFYIQLSPQLQDGVRAVWVLTDVCVMCWRSIQLSLQRAGRCVGSANTQHIAGRCCMCLLPFLRQPRLYIVSWTKTGSTAEVENEIPLRDVHGSKQRFSISCSRRTFCCRRPAACMTSPFHFRYVTFLRVLQVVLFYLFFLFSAS